MTKKSSSTLSTRPSSKEDAAALYESSIDEASDRLSALREQEMSAAYRRVDYLEVRRGELSAEFRTEHRAARSKMCHWCYQLADITTLSRHAVSRSMGYLDRFVSSSHPRARRALVDKREYQLAAMTCLYVSVKLHEPLAMDASLVAEISAGCYTTDEIVNMEVDILSALEWRVNDPTPQEYACLLLGLLSPKSYHFDIDTLSSLLDGSKHACEVASADYDLGATCRPSELGLAAVLNGVEDADGEGLLSSGEDVRSFLERAVGAMRGVDIRRVCAARRRMRRMTCPSSGGSSQEETLPVAHPSTLKEQVDREWRHSSPRSVVTATVSPSSSNGKLRRRRRASLVAARCA